MPSLGAGQGNFLPNVFHCYFENFNVSIMPDLIHYSVALLSCILCSFPKEW
jgi:hypothetical protein